MSDINDTKDTAGMQPDQEAKPALSADEQMIQDGFTRCCRITLIQITGVRWNA